MEEDDVLSNTRVEPHVEEKVQPGKSDCDRTRLPLDTRAKSSLAQSCRVTDGDVEGEEIDDQIKDEDEGKAFDNCQWLPPRNFPQLCPNRGEFSVDEEEQYHSDGE